MNYIVCPKCETENSVYRTICVNCGENLMEAKISLGLQPLAPSSPATQSTRPATTSSAPQRTTPNPSHTLRFPTKFSAFKGIADLCNTIAVIMAVLATIIGFVGFIVLFSEGVIGLALIFFAVLFGVSGYVAYKLIAESIYVILDIEMNTRQTAAYLKFWIDHD
jgi:hypothetical protein